MANLQGAQVEQNGAGGVHVEDDGAAPLSKTAKHWKSIRWHASGLDIGRTDRRIAALSITTRRAHDLPDPGSAPADGDTVHMHTASGPSQTRKASSPSADDARSSSWRNSGTLRRRWQSRETSIHGAGLPRAHVQGEHAVGARPSLVGTASARRRRARPQAGAAAPTRSARGGVSRCR
jgi:hypothetical protein